MKFLPFSATHFQYVFSPSAKQRRKNIALILYRVFMNFSGRRGEGHLLKVDAYMYLRLGPYLNKYGKCKVFTWGLHLYMHLPQE